MTVEGIFAPSADTEQGKGTHRRVDRPSATKPEPSAKDDGDGRKSTEKLEESDSDPDRPRSVGNLALTSERLGLTATLDLAEINGDVAVPVEYRQGRPRRNGGGQVGEPVDELMEEPRLLPGPEPWPTDRVQLGLQVLLLEDAGYTVPEAYLYYAAERLGLRVEVDDALRRDALEELEAARRTAEGQRPPPLVNDPRCPWCSLQPNCLPDEINHQRSTALTVDGQPVDEKLTPRKLWPPRDDGIHVALQREGVRVGVRGQSVRITDKDGAVVRDLPLANVESLAVVGPVQLSTQALDVSAFNRGELTEGHFLSTASGCALTDAGRKAFFSAYGRRMDTEVAHPVFEYRLSYRRMLMLHARLIAAWLLGEAPTLAFLTTR